MYYVRSPAANLISVYFRKIINVGKTSDVGIVQKGLIVLWESLWVFFFLGGFRA